MSPSTLPRIMLSGLCVTSAAAIAVAALSAGAAHATSIATGDSRSVSQPSVPSACKTLTATLTASSEKFSSSTEANPPDTSRIQSALTSCAGTGKAVELTTSGSLNSFLSGPLTVPSGVYLVVNAGTTLYASLVASEYQKSGASSTCGTVASSGSGCVPFISVTGSNSGVEGIRSSSGSQGAIDGRGGLDIYGTSTTWWNLATTAQSDGENQNNPRLIQASAGNFTLYDIDLLNSPMFHVVFENASGFTAWGVRIKTPANARNTDGIDPAGATNVTIEDSYIQDGDDGVAIKGASASKDITIANDHFYGTHGISIGSETNGGVSNVLVENNTIQGTDSSGITSTSDNGIRIKSDSSRGGTVSTISYINTCETGVKYLMDFDPYYSSATGSLIPYFTNIVVSGLKTVSSSSSAESVLHGYSTSYPLGLTLQYLSLDKTTTSSQYANIDLYSAGVSPSGTGVSVTNLSSPVTSGSVPSCSFPSYPSL